MQEERSERIVFHICLLLSILSGAAYWLLHGVLRPDEPLEVALFYRFGDYDYLPLIENLARFRYGEIADWATQGEGLFPFPFLSSLPYALGSAALGVWGYPLADTLLSLARFFSFYWIARQILPRRLSAAPAALLAMVALGPYGLSDALTLWSYRLPRPFVTSILALAALATLFAALQKAASDNLRPLLFFAVFTVALAHGDAHGALMLGLCGLAVMLILVFRERRHLKNVLIAGFTLLALALTALPFQLAMKPDISARWGFFSAPAWPPAFVLTPHFLKALAVLAAASLAHLVMTRRGKELPAPYSAALTLLWCLQAAAFLALPLSWLLLSGSIQIDHFVRRQNYAASMTYLLGALFLCRLIPAGWVTVSARLAGMARGIPCALLSALLFLALVQNSKMNFATGTESQPRSYTKLADGEPIWPPDNRYRRALTEVFAELREPRYDGARVMGSFDHELLMWWMAFRQGASYAGKGWLSLLPTETIEQRSVHLARRLGADKAWLKRQLESDYFIGLFLGYGRYVVNERYSLAPLEDYDEDARARILATPVNYSWELAMPESDKTRILGYFAEPLAPDERLDLVVLARIGEFAALTFDDPAFEKTFDNDIFAIWIRRDLQ